MNRRSENDCWFEISWGEGPFQLDEVARWAKENDKAADQFHMTDPHTQQRISYREFARVLGERATRKPQ